MAVDKCNEKSPADTSTRLWAFRLGWDQSDARAHYVPGTQGVLVKSPRLPDRPASSASRFSSQVMHLFTPAGRAWSLAGEIGFPQSSQMPASLGGIAPTGRTAIALLLRA